MEKRRWKTEVRCDIARREREREREMERKYV